MKATHVPDRRGFQISELGFNRQIRNDNALLLVTPAGHLDMMTPIAMILSSIANTLTPHLKPETDSCQIQRKHP